MDLVSVIVPVYNVEKYIDICIQSIVDQTYENIEILLVDDGSTDNSGKICDKWSERDARIFVIHKENGGLSDARNAGIEAAKGEYLVFVDSDDYIDIDLIYYCYEIIQKEKVDIITYGYQMVDEEGEAQEDISHSFFMERLTGEELMHQFLSIGKGSVMAWNKFYKKDVWSELRFPVGKIHEDEFVIADIFLGIQEAIVTNKPLYFYRQRAGSIMSSRGTKAYYDALEALRQCCKKVDFDNEMYLYALNRLYSCLIKTYWIEKEEDKRCALKKEYNEWTIFSTLFRWINWKQKIIYGSFFLSPRLYWLLELSIRLKHIIIDKKSS